jgi:cell division septum initiation protein DivIVA
VSDLPDELHRRAARALVVSRVNYARYLQLLEAQEAALRADDLDLLARLAAEGVARLAELEETVHLPPDLIEALGAAAGPHRDDIGNLLAAVQAEVGAAHSEIRRFTAALEARKGVMLGVLARLQNPDGPSPG